MVARIGIVTGVRREADCLSQFKDDPDVDVGIAGADPFRAGNLADHMFVNGAAGVLSFGLCGALDPGLAAGAVILPNRIISSEGRALSCDPDWIGRMADVLGDMVDRTDVTLVHSGTIVSSPRRKGVLRANTGADVVDMESFAVGMAAKRVIRPFAVIRVVSDKADTELPAWTDKIVTPSGKTDGIRLLKNLITHPRDLGKLLTLGRGSVHALKVLRSVARRLGPGFAFG